MRKILYSLHFRGKMTPATDDGRLLHATGAATGCIVSTTIGPAGMECGLQASAGELAFLEAALRVTGPESFLADGQISFGDDSEHELRFTTSRPGQLTESPEPGTMAGIAQWEVEGGKGQFAEARGYIASTFTLNGGGDLDEFHSGLIFLPE